MRSLCGQGIGVGLNGVIDNVCGSIINICGSDPENGKLQQRASIWVSEYGKYCENGGRGPSCEGFEIQDDVNRYN
jgi:hypothetical protein